jgi:GNAT superfamily N-acetyltransferase
MQAQGRGRPGQGPGAVGETRPGPGRGTDADIEVVPDPLCADDTIALLQEHLEEMYRLSPPESVHALDLEQLRATDISFWSARHQGVLLGCIALRELDATDGEIKSMRTVATARRLGVAGRLMQVLLEEAAARGYVRLSLETGTQDGFAPARAFYRRHGFQVCGPFADYRLDPCSIFMTLQLAGQARQPAPA